MRKRPPQVPGAKKRLDAGSSQSPGTRPSVIAARPALARSMRPAIRSSFAVVAASSRDGGGTRSNLNCGVAASPMFRSTTTETSARRVAAASMTVIRALHINLVFETNNHVILSEAKDLELRILNYYIRESSSGARVLRGRRHGRGAGRECH